MEYWKERYYRFQLTRSRGAWHWKGVTRNGFKNNFNSHAHVERDCLADWLKYENVIISTHTLTWSVTIIWNFCEIFYKFQLTRSRGAWLKISWDMQLVKLFQLTRSRGAWRFATGTNYQEASAFQLTRSRGAWLHVKKLENYQILFQLTRSRGARPGIFWQ